MTIILCLDIYPKEMINILVHTNLFSNVYNNIVQMAPNLETILVFINRRISQRCIYNTA